MLLSRPPGYLLAVDPLRYDVACFEVALESSRRGLAAGDPDSARREIHDALGLWRGPALAEFAYEDFARPEAARLEEMRVVARELRAEADLALGRHLGAVAELEGLVAEHPLRERLWGLLILALYRSGRQSDALRAYQQCRTTLGDELGLEPGPDLRRLEEAVLAQSNELDWRPPAGRPGSIQGESHSATEAPVSLPTHSGIGLVGRIVELERLEAAWKRARTGAGGIVLVTGEAGIGKTRLVDELAERVGASGGAVASGRCVEGAGAPAYWPWARALADLARIHAGGDLGDLVALAGVAPERLVPLLILLDDAAGQPAEPPGRDPAQARFRLNEAVVQVLLALADRRPLLIVLDDLHWADPGSVLLLERLGPRLAGASLLVVGTFRDVEVAASQPLAGALAVIARGPVFDRVALQGLRQADLGPFIAQATGADASAELVAVVHARTEGNPFFAAELVRLLDSEHHLADAAAAKRTRVPTGVLDVVRQRLARLPEQTNAVLSVAAVIGDEFELALLEGVTGLDGEVALDALELALVSGLVDDVAGRPGWFRFVHALVRQSIHDGLSQLRRARLHVRIAEAIERQRPRDDAADAASAAHLMAGAGAEEPASAVPVLLRAAVVAQRQLAYELAESLLRRGLELTAAMPADGERDTHERAARARLGVLLSWRQGHSTPEVIGAFERASAVGGPASDADEDVRLGYGLFLGSLFRPDLPRALDQARRLLDAGEQSGNERYLLAGHAAMGMLSFHRGDLAVSAGHSTRAAALADAIGAPWCVSVLQADFRVTTRGYAALSLALTGHEGEAATLSDLAVERAGDAEHPFSTGLALFLRAWMQVVLDRADAALHTAAAAAASLGDQGHAGLSGAVTVFQAWAAARAGDPSAAVARAREGRAALRSTGMHVLEPFLLALQAEVEQQAGLLDDALASAEEGLVAVEDTGNRFYEAELRRRRGELLAALPGNAGDAEKVLLEALEVARSQGAFTLEARARSSLDELLAR